MNNEERELFECWYEEIFGDSEIGILPNKQYSSKRKQHSWDAWLASKNQAVPKGYVVVSKCDLAKVLNCVTDDCLVDTGTVEVFNQIESLVAKEINQIFNVDN